jgi:DNA mismatch repair ATPase MutS
MEPFRAGQEPAAQARAARICDFAARLSPELVATLRAGLQTIPDVAGALTRVSMGEMLEDPDFLEVRRFCETAERFEASLGGEPLLEGIASDASRAVAGALAVSRSEAAEFYLADAFDADLAAARANLAQLQAEMEAVRGREKERVAQALGREEIAGDEFIVMRADLHRALPAGVRVVREAPTYVLCALDYGPAFLTALERREAAFDAVAALEERVRARLSSVVRDRAAALSATAVALGELDVTLGAVRYAQRYECTAPAVTADATLEFVRGRFLPLAAELAHASRRFVPIDLDLRGVAVLTGPNMGGKSVSLQTCGFLALAAAFGLPLPADRARIGLFDRIAWLGVGLAERAGGLLSSYAQELTALKAVLECDAPRLLILADEFARTTTPHEGRALAIALLERLGARNACGLVATHLQGIAAAAGVPHFAVRGLKELPAAPATHQLREALEQLAAAMDYRIVEVTGEELLQADAIALAQLLGVDPEFVASAYRALSQ